MYLLPPSSSLVFSLFLLFSGFAHAFADEIKSPPFDWIFVYRAELRNSSSSLNMTGFIPLSVV